MNFNTTHKRRQAARPRPIPSTRRVEQAADGVDARRDQIEAHMGADVGALNAVLLAIVKPECEQRFSHGLGGRSEVAAILGGGPQLDPLLHGVGIQNPAFDVTPAKYVTGIITERGVLSAPYDASMKAMLAKI